MVGKMPTWVGKVFLLPGPVPDPPHCARSLLGELALCTQALRAVSLMRTDRPGTHVAEICPRGEGDIKGLKGNVKKIQD